MPASVHVVALGEDGPRRKVVRILLVAVAARQDDGDDLGEAEEQTNSSGKMECVIDCAFQLRHARRTLARFGRSVRAAF